MAQPTVKTVQFIDPRIEPEPDPVYDYVIGPTQNQYYKIAASSTSNSSIFFNNLTTLGADRAYLDTMEIEITAEIKFHTNLTNVTSGTGTSAHNEHYLAPYPLPGDWTFDSFPLNKCCESARVNLNGGAFFSQPLSYIRAKERYMDQGALAQSYQNVCPTHAPVAQYESTRDYNLNYSSTTALALFNSYHHPSRLGVAREGYDQSQAGMSGGTNQDILRLGAPIAPHTTTDGWLEWGYENYLFRYPPSNNTTSAPECVVRVTWREPLFCSPFSSRYDATYGRPLYNITSIDINLILQNLGNMIRVVQFGRSVPALKDNGSTGTEDPKAAAITDYAIDIKDAMLCYQVCTIPTSVSRPLSTLTPYRRFVPYITAIKQDVPLTGGFVQNIASGVYTLNEIPTAIWIFVAPELSVYQNNAADSKSDGTAGAPNTFPNYDSNKLFAYIRHTSITMANTTQLLNQATPLDLYRIAKANGCQDSYMSWQANDTINQYTFGDGTGPVTTAASAIGNYPACSTPGTNFLGAGSVLRLIPGVDLVVPDQPLIPGANANNMVFQAFVDAYIPPRSAAQSKYALWFLFEYVGVASISPGQCEISMNPLGSGEIMSVSPIVSATSMATEGKLEGSGAIWEWIKKLFRIGAKVVKDNHLASEGLNLVKDRIKDENFKKIAGTAAEFAKKQGYGAPPSKKCCGGAVMGLGDWT